MKSERWAAAAIFLLTLFCFAPALRNGFVWDDWALIVKTAGFKGFDARHWAWMLTTTHLANFCPLAWFSYTVDYSLWGLDPRGYHLTNILLHASNAVLFFLTARVLLRRVLVDDRGAAAAAALFFALHPLRVESVAWASERRDVLAGFFYLLTILCYLRYSGGAARRRFYFAALGAYALAALSKPSVAPLPAVLLLLDYWPLQRKHLIALLTEKLPFFAIAAADALLVLRAQEVSGNFIPVARHGAAGRLAQALYGLGFYLFKTVLPLDLSAFYPLAELRAPASWALAGAAILGAAEFAMRAARVPAKARRALWAYYAVLLLPVLGLFQNGTQMTALRYSYLSCLGWALLAGTAAFRAPRAAAGLVAAVLVALTWAQLALWRDDRTLWASVLARFPDCPEAHLNLAGGLLREGAFEAADAQASEAIRLSGAGEVSLLIRARARQQSGRLAQARADAEQALRVEPKSADARTLLGSMSADEGKLEDSLNFLRDAALLQPGSARAQANFGAALARLGRFDEAAGRFAEAARLDPSEPVYREELRQAERDRAR